MKRSKKRQYRHSRSETEEEEGEIQQGEEVLVTDEPRQNDGEDVLQILDDLVEDEEEEEEENERRKREIRSQSLQTQQAIQDLRMLITELGERPTCAPRRIQYRIIHRESERYLRCAFCDAAGQHYSDSCPQVQDAESKRRILDSERRCYMCFEVLLIVCPGGRKCRKWANPCCHCKTYGHHSAVCEFPEKSDVIRGRLERAREALRSAEIKLERLREELRMFPDN